MEWTSDLRTIQDIPYFEIPESLYQGIKIYGLPETISASTMAVEIGQRQYLRRVKVIFIQKSLPGSFGI